MGTTTKVAPLAGPSKKGHVVTAKLSPMFSETFKSLVDTDPRDRKFVEVKVPKGLVDMFGRVYPRRVTLCVHHFDDYGVLVEGTYEIVLARKALKKVGYDPAVLWGYRPVQVGQELRGWPDGLMGGGRSAIAFYFDKEAGLS